MTNDQFLMTLLRMIDLLIRDNNPLHAMQGEANNQ
jgi:hypothetical protein